MSSGAAALKPTFHGHVSTTEDALILFEACLQGHLSNVSRRPYDRERSSLIRSGSVFIYEENASGIRRWTDGVTWSPSRILGNFLVYRELDQSFPPGEKKRAMKKQNRRPGRPGEPYPGSRGNESASFGSEGQPSAAERQLIGSLIDSYGFKSDGLVKKTMSVTVEGVTYHLVSYYNVHDVMANNLRTPVQAENLQYVRPRLELTSKQSFRSPILELEEVHGLRDRQNPCEYRVGHQGCVQNYHVLSPMAQCYPPRTQTPAGGYLDGVPPMQTSYLQTLVATPQVSGQRAYEYAPYNQTPPRRGYEASETPPSTTMPPVAGDRSHSMMYPPPSNSQGPVDNLSPVSMEACSSANHRPGHSMRSCEDHYESAPGGGLINARGAQYYPDSSSLQIHQPPYSQIASRTNWW